MDQKPPGPDRADAGEVRLYSLDAARGVASFAVVLFHWPHHLGLSKQMESVPFYPLLAPIYNYGGLAVTFFFSLSGFVFYWIYSAKIYARKVSAPSFAALRFSRLYPLHLLTLFLCVVGQAWIVGMGGRPFVFQLNDGWHFALNLGLIQGIGLEQGYSFNGPSWSISVEVTLYLLFFLSCRWIKPSVWTCAAWVLVSWGLARTGVVFSSAATFFMGGIAYYAWEKLRPTCTWKHTVGLILLTGGAWFALSDFVDPDRIRETVDAVRTRLGPSGLTSPVVFALKISLQRVAGFVMFPLLVLTLALSEVTWRRLPWHRLHEFGNMSYGIYLLHFPLQLAFGIYAFYRGYGSDFYKRPPSLILFMVLILVISWLSYRLFEKPAMVWLRTKRGTKKTPAVVV